MLKSDQCPFTHDAIKNLKAVANELDLIVNVKELNHHHEMAQQQSLTPFGVFTVIYEGEIITYYQKTKNKFR
ncbi:hypothetical protein AB3U99_11420 [Niallia sp. JL1B1071]|uniref:hypothetical protein n=1 Tax=Niallia tiangongensis TaxID=3237105 RepID=UPI0037DC216B